MRFGANFRVVVGGSGMNGARVFPPYSALFALFILFVRRSRSVPTMVLRTGILRRLRTTKGAVRMTLVRHSEEPHPLDACGTVCDEGRISAWMGSPHA
jgi:hypothetical protein